MARNKSSRNKAAFKAKQRRRTARRYGILRVRKAGGRMTGRVRHADRSRN